MPGGGCAMSISRRIAASLLLILAAGSIRAAADDGGLAPGALPALGTPAPADYESVVSADGSGLPPGRGSVAEGRVLFAARCASCHGADGRMPGNALAGGRGTLATAHPVKTVGSYWPYATTLYDYIARAMPYGAEKSLDADQVYAVTAFVLALNGIVDDAAVLDARSLTAVRMPNRDGFVELHEAPDPER